MIVSASYISAALAIYVAGLYLVYRLKLNLTASSMLLGFLLFVYGPAYLIYMLLRRPISVVDLRISNSSNFDEVVISLNLSIAIMFVCVIAGIEFVDRLAPRSALALREVISGWNCRPLESGGNSRPWLLLIAIVAMVLLMLWISLSEHHIATVAGFLSLSGNEAAKAAYRQQYGGSQVYLYNLAVASIAPMMVILGSLSGLTRRWWPLLVSTALLLALTALGKVETLSKAPFALFVIQLLLAAYLVFRNNIGWRVALSGIVVALIVFLPSIRIAIPELDHGETLKFFYYRAFDVSNAALLEYFAAFPERIPHMWGGNIRPIASVWGLEYVPSFNTVSILWRSAAGSTTTAMFIADAWADFSYLGIVGFSIAVGVFCRAIDVLLLTGKTVAAVAGLASVFIGVYNLMISALPTSMLSGGLVLPPLLAIILVRGQEVLERCRGPQAVKSECA